MGTWQRSSLWRQGSVFTSDAASALGLVSDRAPEQTAAVVISHDCDLAQSAEQEPVVEVIVGRFVSRTEGNFTHAKNVRCLHLPFTAGARQCSIELEPQNRRPVFKATDAALAMADFHPSDEFKLSPTGRRTLQRWLAARYDRSAFPDEFDRRLKVETGVAERLSKAFDKTGDYIPAVFFDVDAGREIDRDGPDDPYELVVTVLYSTDSDPQEAEIAAEAAKARIEQVFRTRCRTKNESGVEQWRWIELQAVEVMSDQSLTYAQSIQLMTWRADHISLRAEPPQPIAEF